MHHLFAGASDGQVAALFFLARTRPLLCPRRSIRLFRAQHERAGRARCPARATGSTGPLVRERVEGQRIANSTTDAAQKASELPLFESTYQRAARSAALVEDALAARRRRKGSATWSAWPRPKTALKSLKIPDSPILAPSHRRGLFLFGCRSHRGDCNLRTVVSSVRPTL